MENKKLICGKCEEVLDISKAWWDNDGLGYSTKLVRCPKCGLIHIIKVTEDESIDLNKDLRFYQYR